MTKFYEDYASRAAIYEERTGDNLPLNVLSKISEVTGGLLLLETVATNGTLKEGIVSAGLLLGGLVTDRMTGGLRGYRLELARRAEFAEQYAEAGAESEFPN